MNSLNNIFDSHAHYNDRAFDDDREEMLAGLPKKGVSIVVNIGAAMKDSGEILGLVKKYDYIYGVLGVHPDSADDTPEGFTDILEKQILSEPKIRAVGEIGLDYHYEGYTREKQLWLFEEQLKLAERIDMPVVIHSRDACGDTMELLHRYRPRGVMHCFGYSAEIAREVVSMGMYVGFTGVLTFKNAKKALKALREVPIDRLLLETDCPYMAPEPYRGKRSDSSMIEKTAEKAAEIYGITAQELLDITNQNGRTFYGIS